jgi:HSP20 family protein
MRGLTDFFERLPLGSGGESGGAPVGCQMDIYEEDGSLKIRAACAGVKSEDLKLSIDDHVLTLSGEVRDEHASKPGSHVYHRETFVGKFSRSVRLPENVDEDNIDAEMRDGCVIITLPRREQRPQNRRELQIRGGARGEQRIQAEHHDEAAPTEFSAGSTGSESFDEANRAAEELDESRPPGGPASMK